MQNKYMMRAEAAKIALQTLALEGFRTINDPWRFRSYEYVKPPSDEQTENIRKCISDYLEHVLDEIRETKRDKI